MGFSAGKFDRRIRLERYGVTYDEWNQPVEGWSEIETVWATWRRATANERLASGQVGAQVTDIFEVRWETTLADLNPKDRLVFKDAVYDIAEVTEIGRQDGLLIRGSAKADKSP
jgi:SPP1 family predicted phage head-tail adaptor